MVVVMGIRPCCSGELGVVLALVFVFLVDIFCEYPESCVGLKKIGHCDGRWDGYLSFLFLSITRVSVLGGGDMLD